MINNAMKNLRWDFLKQMDAYVRDHGDYSAWKDYLFTNFKHLLFNVIAGENSACWNDICEFFGELTKDDEEGED